MNNLILEQFDVVDEKSLTEINGGDGVAQCIIGTAGGAIWGNAAFGLIGAGVGTFIDNTVFCTPEAY